MGNQYITFNKEYVVNMESYGESVRHKVLLEIYQNVNMIVIYEYSSSKIPSVVFSFPLKVIFVYTHCDNTYYLQIHTQIQKILFNGLLHRL